MSQGLHRVAIVGSCVSRDALAHASASDLELSFCIARSSLASALAETCWQDFDTSRIASDFQRRMVRADVDKALPALMQQASFDILLVDFIDERFNLFRRRDGAICTLSNELLSSGFIPSASPGKVIRSGSEEFLDLWSVGWRALLSRLESDGKLDRLLVNEVYWSHTSRDGQDYLPSYDKNRIDAANELLRKLYMKVRQDIGKGQIATFSHERLLGGEQHRWGRSPFHYGDEYYIDLVQQVKARCRQLGYQEIDRKTLVAQPEAVVRPGSPADESRLTFSGGHCLDGAGKEIDCPVFSGNGVIRLDETALHVDFRRAGDTYQLRFKPWEQQVDGRLSIRFRLSGWESVRYVAIGYVHEGQYDHVKAPNPPFDTWQEATFRYGEAAAVASDSRRTGRGIPEEIKVYVRGIPSPAGATLSLESIMSSLDLPKADETSLSAKEDMQAAFLPAAVDDGNVQHVTYRCNICGSISEKMPDTDVCKGCGSRARHRQINAALAAYPNLFESKDVLACHAITIEKKLLLGTVRQLTNFDVRPVQGLDLQMDIQEMSQVGDATYDAFMAIHVLNHVKDDRLALAEVHRVLRPGGVALITVPYRENEPTTTYPNITEHYGADALAKFGVGSYRWYGFADFVAMVERDWDVEILDGFDDLIQREMKVFLLRKNPSKSQGSCGDIVAEGVPVLSYQACVEQLAEHRSLDKWPSRNYTWESLESFTTSKSIESGIHSIKLGTLILDVYIDIVVGAPAYVYLHGNCPRAPNFKLPVFSGSNVTDRLRVTKIVPSDPALLLDGALELAWHAGCREVNLQAAYRAVFEKVVEVALPEQLVFWGGSGGGFAALYHSFHFPKSTALVWNPQTKILSYVAQAVDKYLATAYGTNRADAAPFPTRIVHDLCELYRDGYSNRIIYIQNDEDWHVQDHLAPFLRALKAESVDLTGPVNGIVAKDMYLFVGRFSQGHNPPNNTEIHCALQQTLAGHGSPEDFDFAPLIRGQHGRHATPDWVTGRIAARRIPAVRSDWPHHRAAPAVDLVSPTCIKFSTGASLDVGTDGQVDWDRQFETNLSTNVHELYGLAHVGRLLGAYEETKDAALLDGAVAILRSFLRHFKSPDALERIMTSRGMSRADHSMSVRANVLVKVLQFAAENKCAQFDVDLIGDTAGHLWDIGDFIADPSKVYPSNHGMMACLTLLQIANQFRELKYISDQYIRSADRNLLKLVEGSFDRDGWTNENTVGYHSFILRLLRDYVDYAMRNAMEGVELRRIKDYVEKGTQALSLCVRQDGSIPPIGDSPLYKGDIVSTNHSKLFGESGFLIIKDQRLYATLVCGSRSDNHKQVDDSSITVHYDGEDLIVDGGSYCYDAKDPYRRYLESFRGHSGLYADSAASLTPKAYLARRKEAAIEEFAELAAGRFAKARYAMDLDGLWCQRRLFIDYSGAFTIADLAKSDASSSAFNQSFLLAPQLRLVHREGNSLLFEGERYGLALAHYSASDVIVEVGATEPVVAGWCSINWRERLPTHQVRFRQQGRDAQFLTGIRIFRKGDGQAALEELRLPPAAVMSRLYA